VGSNDDKVAVSFFGCSQNLFGRVTFTDQGFVSFYVGKTLVRLDIIAELIKNFFDEHPFTALSDKSFTGIIVVLTFDFFIFFSTDEVLARCRAGAITGKTFCWRDGMEGWKPVAEVQPFQEVLAQPATQEAAAQGLDNLGKTFTKAIDFIKRKVKATSLRLTVGKHKKYRQKLLSELGEMLYMHESDISLFSQEPHAGKLAQVKQVNQLIGSLRDQIEDLENTGGKIGKNAGQ